MLPSSNGCHHGGPGCCGFVDEQRTRHVGGKRRSTQIHLVGSGGKKEKHFYAHIFSSCYHFFKKISAEKTLAPAARRQLGGKAGNICMLHSCHAERAAQSEITDTAKTHSQRKNENICHNFSKQSKHQLFLTSLSRSRPLVQCLS